MEGQVRRLDVDWDPRWVDAARRGSFRAVRSALKEWILDAAVSDRLSVSLDGLNRTAGTTNARLHLGVSSLAPKLGVAWTASETDLDWSVDGHGVVALSCASRHGGSYLGMRAEMAPREHRASALLTAAF